MLSLSPLSLFLCLCSFGDRRAQLNSLARSMEIVRRISLLVPRAVVQARAECRRRFSAADLSHARLPRWRMQESAQLQKALAAQDLELHELMDCELARPPARKRLPGVADPAAARRQTTSTRDSWWSYPPNWR
jgi:hypothetical protein